MKKTFLIPILVFSTLAIIYLSFVCGIFYQTKKDSVSVSLAKDIATQKLNIATRGYVESISGRDISISDGSSVNMKISVKADAKISILKKGAMLPENTDFASIKTGDFLTAFIQPTEKGAWEASTLYSQSKTE
jgi:hypothetical protein